VMSKRGSARCFDRKHKLVSTFSYHKPLRKIIANALHQAVSHSSHLQTVCRGRALLATRERWGREREGHHCQRVLEDTRSSAQLSEERVYAIDIIPVKGE
jgi:hypothetical protein